MVVGWIHSTINNLIDSTYGYFSDLLVYYENLEFETEIKESQLTKKFVMDCFSNYLSPCLLTFQSRIFGEDVEFSSIAEEVFSVLFGNLYNEVWAISIMPWLKYQYRRYKAGSSSKKLKKFISDLKEEYDTIDISIDLMLKKNEEQNNGLKPLAERDEKLARMHWDRYLAEANPTNMNKQEFVHEEMAILARDKSYIDRVYLKHYLDSVDAYILMEQVERSRIMIDINEILEQLNETLTIQFGYIIIFLIYSPWIAFFAFVTNLLNLLLLSYSLFTSARRMHQIADTLPRSTITPILKSISFWSMFLPPLILLYATKLNIDGFEDFEVCLIVGGVLICLRKVMDAIY